MAIARRHGLHRRLHGVEALEDRRLMAVVPALNSLPGAARSIFLDFDGDFQAVWNRTDSGQTYRNVDAKAPNLTDAQIRTIWETVAEDFAPFKVNVTTVQPPSFANGVALRVVIAGNVSGQLVTGNTTVTISGDRFITNDGVNPLDTSGYAALNSFTNAEPNVVYVFAGYMQTPAWGATSQEGHSRSLAALIANTASHEAGHSFGLPHHAGVDAGGAASGYHVGTNLTTPIMGDNTAGDRTLWSSYNVGSTTYDAIARLTATLGARTPDHPGGTWFARALNWSLTTTGPHASVSGVISTHTDQDWFKFSSGGATHNFSLSTVEFANLDAKLDVYKVISYDFGPVVSLIASIDPATTVGQPFSGLGASYSAFLAKGDYMVAVKSHGGYGDLGNYTLRINVGPSLHVFAGTTPTLVTTSVAAPTTSGNVATKVIGATFATSAGQAAGGAASNQLALDAAYGAWNLPAVGKGKPVVVPPATAAIEASGAALDKAFAAATAPNCFCQPLAV